MCSEECAISTDNCWKYCTYLDQLYLDFGEKTNKHKTNLLKHKNMKATSLDVFRGHNKT